MAGGDKMLKAKSEVARRVGAWAPALDFPRRNNVSPGTACRLQMISPIHDMYSTYPVYSWLLIQGDYRTELRSGEQLVSIDIPFSVGIINYWTASLFV